MEYSKRAFLLAPDKLGERNFSHPPGPVKIKDIILMYDDTYGYKVKLYKADTETSTGLMRDKISRLNFLIITIITKEIESETFLYQRDSQK